jgi:hypothetical protein
MQGKKGIGLLFTPAANVANPCHFSTDPDPEPGIRTTEIRIRIWIRILHFSLVAFMMARKIRFFPKVFCFLH